MTEKSFSFSLPRPDDFHVHFRADALLQTVVPHTAAEYGRALVMPNLMPPITTVKQAADYHAEILAQTNGIEFTPLMTLALTSDLNPDEVSKAKESGIIQAVKLYPIGVTTNSATGIADIRDAYPVFSATQEEDMVLSIHGESPDAGLDVFDRERVFAETTLRQIIKDFPRLRIVCEHITTRVLAEFLSTAPDTVAATITPHHLLCDRNDMLDKGMNPHLYCKPILKRKEDREALISLALSGHPRIFAGTDSAPHPQHKKESSCGCAGVYTGYCSVELYAEVFNSAADLSTAKTQEVFTAFMSRNGAVFYHLPENTGTLELRREKMNIPASFQTADKENIIPFRAGGSVGWSTK